MKILRKTIMISMIIILTLLLINNTQSTIFTSVSLNNSREIANVGVLFYSLDDKYAQLIKQRLEEIQEENQNKVRFTFFDGKNNIAIQNSILDSILKNNFDLLVSDLFNVKEIELEDIIFKIKQKNIPAIFLNVNPEQASKISKDYDKAAFLSADYKQFGIEQGNVIVNLWNDNKDIIDKNRDNILNYVILKGKTDNPIAGDITNAFVSTINNSGIKAQQLQQINGDWNREGDNS